MKAKCKLTGKVVDINDLAREMATEWVHNMCDDELVYMMMDGHSIPNYAGSSWDEIVEEYNDGDDFHEYEKIEEVKTTVFKMKLTEEAGDVAWDDPGLDKEEPKCDCGGTKLKLPHSHWCSIADNT